jgi:hypothetical protein
VRASILIGAVLLVGGAAAAGVAASKRAPATSKANEFEAAVAGLEKLVLEVQQQLDARAQKLVDANDLRRQIATDESTFRSSFQNPADLPDLLPLLQAKGPGEVVEFGYREEGKPQASSIFRDPSSALPLALAERAFGLELAEGKLVAAMVRPVSPSQQPLNEPVRKGLVAIQWNVDLGPAVAGFADIPARLELGEGKGGVPLGAEPSSTQATTPKALTAFPSLRVVGAVPRTAAKTMIPAIAGGAGAGVLGLLLLAIGLARRPSKPLAPAAPEPSPNATGTPPPVTVAGVGVTGPSVPRATGMMPSGNTLGRYELVRQLGAGGMAEVFLAKSLGEAGFSKQVALKLLHPHLGKLTAAVDHFLDEARLASNLTHPNIVQITDLGRVDDAYFIAMEYVDGTDLERVLQGARKGGRAVPLDVALTIVRRVCDGLDFAHKALGPDGAPLGLVHRDVKSANVMVSRRGEIKVGDFGIAKANTQVHVTQVGETKGTPSMMAPEQRMGSPVDARADVYSVAAVAYEIVTGTEVNLDLAMAISKGFEGWPHLPAPSTVRAELPVELDAIIMGALAFEPDARPASCHDLEERIAAVAVARGLVADDKAIARWLTTELTATGGVRTEAATAQTSLA